MPQKVKKKREKEKWKVGEERNKGFKGVVFEKA